MVSAATLPHTPNRPTCRLESLEPSRASSLGGRLRIEMREFSFVDEGALSFFFHRSSSFLVPNMCLRPISSSILRLHLVVAP